MKPKRFLLFADFLGTADTYSRSIDLVVRRRDLLESILAAYVTPILDECDIYLYVFSDSAIVTCPQLKPLLDVAARMFRSFIEISLDQRDSRSEPMLLRGAICYGTTAQSTTLANSGRVTVIPMLDDSLPKAYKLEGIRKGSRLLLDGDVPDSLIAGVPFLYHWGFITGKGEPRSDLFEFLWPGMAYEGEDELLVATERVRKFWLTRLKGFGWGGEYDHGIMPHLDETLKLFVRSLAGSAEQLSVCNYLFSILPVSESDMVNVEFEWGVWFQSLKALFEVPSIYRQRAGDLREKVELVRRITEEKEYWARFRAELEMPDYSKFKDLLASAGL